MNILIVTGIAICVCIVAVLLAAVYAGAKSDENTQRIMLEHWRFNLKVGDYCKVDGITHRITEISSDRRVVTIVDFNDEKFVLMSDCYPAS